MLYGAELPPDADKAFLVSRRTVALNPDCSWCAWRASCRNLLVKPIPELGNIFNIDDIFDTFPEIKLSNMTHIVSILMFIWLIIGQN